MLFVRSFEDEGRAYLAHAWLIDEAAAAPPAAVPEPARQEHWSGADWYVPFNERPGGRSWSDALRYGFVSAAGGDASSTGIRSLPPGARVFAHLPEAGYVGLGQVSGDPQPFDDAVLIVGHERRRMAELPLEGGYRPTGEEADADAAAPDGGDGREWVVPVTWLHAAPREEAFWRTGLFTDPGSVGKLSARFTIKEVARHFGVRLPEI